MNAFIIKNNKHYRHLLHLWVFYTTTIPKKKRGINYQSTGMQQTNCYPPGL
jgi:hypothetical protein